MQLILEDKRKRTLREKEEIKFSSFSSFHLIVISARVKDRKQISTITNDHENLTVSIDNKIFPKLINNKNLTDSPAAFSGSKLHNLLKTVYLLTFLKGKDHTIILNTDKPQNTATFESLEVFTLDLETSLSLINIENQAEDGDRRPWVTFREVILKEGQYDALWNQDRREKVRDPLKEAGEATKQAWQDSYEVAKGILSKSLIDPTNGATNFHSFINKEDFPDWATEENFKIKLGDIYFYELEG